MDEKIYNFIPANKEKIYRDFGKEIIYYTFA
jgi:hypothetical protein